jgi:hypothetical protein
MSLKWKNDRKNKKYHIVGTVQQSNRKTKKYHIVGTVPKSNQIFVERGEIDTPYQTYTWPLTGTGTAIKSVG